MNSLADNEDESVKLLKAHCARLSEHFESVQIFCTKHAGEEEGTVNITWGAGNWFSRYGQINEWVIKQEERSRESVRGE